MAITQNDIPVQKGNINLIFLIYLFLICNKDSLSNKTFRLMALICDLSTINAAEQSWMFSITLHTYMLFSTNRNTRDYTSFIVIFTTALQKRPTFFTY